MPDEWIGTVSPFPYYKGNSLAFPLFIDFGKVGQTKNYDFGYLERGILFNPVLRQDSVTF